MKAIYLAGHRAFLRYVEIPGDDPPLVWLHGWQCSSTGELLPVAVQPSLRGRRSLLVDFLGHGYSDRPVDFNYGLEDHAQSVVALIDELELAGAGLVGHSMGGGVGILVAAARPDVISLLVMAEGNLGVERADPFGGLSEAEFVDHGFSDLVAGQAREAEAQPGGLRAAHLGLTRILEPRAIYRESASMGVETRPPLRSALAEMAIPRWYLNGELSDPELDLQEELAAIGVGWKVVPQTGHPMGLQNPRGFADAVAETVEASWRPSA
jgi:pimeloyl-ACP methyl ester carboxylesterase